MSQRQTSVIATWTLGLLTLLALLFNLPTRLDVMLGPWVLFTVLVGFSLNLGVLLPLGEVSAAHMFGIMAYLALGSGQTAPEALWAVAIGALAGSLVLIGRTEAWLPRRRVTVHSLGTAVEVTAHHTISLLVGGALYAQVGGRLPLGRLNPPDLFPLLTLAAGYALIYLLFYFLRVRLEGRTVQEMLGANWVMLSAVLLLPIPFGILGAVVATDLDELSWTIMIGGLVLMVIAFYGLSRTRYFFRQQVEELSSLSVVSQALRTSLELDALLETIYLQVAHLLDIDHFTVALVAGAQPYVYFPLAVQNGVHTTPPPRPLSRELIDHVITTRAPLLLAGEVMTRAQGHGLVPPGPNIKSWLGVPLLASDRALGAIAVASTDPQRPLREDDQRLLMDIAAQAGIAVENAQLYGQLQNRAYQLSTLNSVSALLTGTLSQEKVLNLLASSVVAVAECNAVAVYVTHEDGLQLARNIGLSESYNTEPPRPLLAAAAAPPDKQRPLVINDVHADARIDDALREQLAQESVAAFVELPLSSAEELLGIIVAFYDRPHPLNGDALELLRTFSVQAALAINNARMYTRTDTALERRIAQIQALYDISQELTATLNLQNIFDRVLARALEGTRADAGGVVIRGDDDLSTRVAAHAGYPETAFENPVVWEGGITLAVLDGGRVIQVDDVRRSSQYQSVIAQTRSQLSVPIRREAETLGVLTLESFRVAAFSEADVTFVTQLAAQAAIAIDNARLFRRIAAGRDRLQVILDSMLEAVLLIDNEGIVALANPRVQRLIGLDPASMVGRLVDDLLLDTGSVFADRLGLTEGELRLLLADLRAGVWDSETVTQATYELSTPRHLYIQRQLVPVRDDYGALLGLLLVLVDQTEQQELARAREDLNRMIVHDLRTPLTAITTSMKLINDLVPPEGKYGAIVERTTESSTRALRKLLNLVDSLLDIGKMESGQLTLERAPTHLNAVVGDVVLEMDPIARELDITLAVDVPYDLPLLDIDREQVERLLLNLVDNALKFTPTHGEVGIRAHLPDSPAAESVRIDVTDTGPGVPDDYKQRLFDRFVQVEGAQGRRRGTGLGLTFCRLAVEAHGGQIWVMDNPGGGAIFAFTLPVADDTAAPGGDSLADVDFDGPLL